MHELDGSDAGGQFLRTALSLSAVRGEAVRLENVRGGRSNPGLRPQHLAVLETLAEICDADVSGNELGAETVAFDPGAVTVTGGQYSVEIDTAGSVTLLFDALLPLVTRLESPLSVTATGGTDVAWSPPMDYYRYVKLPLLRRFGLEAAVELDRRGFYPTGGGRATLRLSPSTLAPIRLGEERRTNPEPDYVRVYSTEAAALADSDVASRQAGGALEALSRALGDHDHDHDHDLTVRDRVETTAESACPGSAIVLRIDGSNTIAGFTALGEPGKRAERVGEEAADAAKRFLASDAPVDRHMADQLLVFLALAGGRVKIPTVTDHVDSSLALLESMGDELIVDREELVVSRENA
ncbi:RNA 3'-terminal phosphate cyclase [Natronoglomus mannanivorans]|uniref:RNA 3'-terminal phosphate cyclase n=1 Tax=Natronoglomus mannanivorans TaxID=2979990 RepID=A0AAP3E3V9_9EURY|nr:RNA 3'-terminal phosphate cyclase [Halobacteria archaeon AArc-xg1-1]